MSAKKKATRAAAVGASDESPYEELVAGLESTLERLESGELSLEEALAAYEQGMGLANRAQERLDTAEQRIQELQELDGE